MSLRDFFPKICNFITIDNVLDNDKAMKKTCMFRGKINAGFFFLFGITKWAHLWGGLSVDTSKC